MRTLVFIVMFSFCAGLVLAWTPAHQKEIASGLAIWKLKDQTHVGYCERGIALLDRGQYNAAIEDFDKSIRLNSKHGRAFNNRANAKERLSDYKGALKDFTSAIELGYANSYHNRAALRSKLGDRHGAIRDLTESISHHKMEFQSYACRGWERECIGDLIGAKADYARVYALKPQGALEYGNIAWITNHLGNHRRAVEYLDEGIKLYSNDPWLFEKRGAMKEELGDKLGALCDYAQSCKLDSHYLHIAYHVYRFFCAYRSEK